MVESRKEADLHSKVHVLESKGRVLGLLEFRVELMVSDCGLRGSDAPTPCWKGLSNKDAALASSGLGYFTFLESMSK
jgi:hypothetical protein